MDRRMNRGNMGNRGYSPYKPCDFGCGEIAGEYLPDDYCEREKYDKCDKHDNNIDSFPIGMCYVPWQCFRNIYENEFTALANGTMFKELDLDWYGRGCK